MEGYEEHAFIPYTNIFAVGPEEARAGRQQQRSGNGEGEGEGKGDGESVSIQATGPDHHPDKQLEDLPKEPRAEYVQSTVTRITRREVSFVRHRAVKTAATSTSTSSDVEMGGTRRLNKRTGTGKKGGNGSVWELDRNLATTTGTGTASHIHLTTEGGTTSMEKQTEILELDLLTPPASKGNSPRTSESFTCCRDCISPSSGCCQASSSSSASALLSPVDVEVRVDEDGRGHGRVEGKGDSHLHAIGQGGLLTPQPSVEFELRPHSTADSPSTRGKTLRGQSCATCLSNSETCCQATSVPVPARTDPNQIEPVAGGNQPPLASLVKGARETEEADTETIRFKYLVYATGSRLPHPLIRLPKKKMEAKDWLKENQKAVREATRVLVVGGGALGIREFRSGAGCVPVVTPRLIFEMVGHGRIRERHQGVLSYTPRHPDQFAFPFPEHL